MSDVWMKVLVWRRLQQINARDINITAVPRDNSISPREYENEKKRKEASSNDPRGVMRKLSRVKW